MSLMAKRSVTFCSSSSSRDTRMDTSPFLVNLTALPAILITACRKRLGSPRRRYGTSGSTRAVNSNPFSWALMAVRSAMSSMVTRRLKSSFSIFSLRASILDKSKISLRSDSRAVLLVRTISANCLCSAPSWVSSRRSVMPIIPFMGVRISWLILARNSLCAAVAASATSLAFFISISTRLRSVMSSMIPRTPMVSP